MKRKQLLIGLGLMGVVGLATGCKDQEARDAAKATQDKVDSIDKYLKDQYKWETDLLAKAICRLEEHDQKANLDTEGRMCTAGAPGETKPIPKYPPEQP